MLAAAGLGAAGVGALALALLPRVYTPWPGALAAFFLASLAAALPAWAVRGRPPIYPLVALVLLPLYRVALLFLRHGAPPWPIRGWGWLTAADFPWWAGASLLAASYAGSMARLYLGIRPREIFLRRLSVLDPGYYGNLEARAHEEDHASLGFAAVTRLFLWPALIGAGVFALVGPGGDRPRVVFCAVLYLALGFYFTGLANARRMRAAWEEQGVPSAGVENRWWEGYGRLLLLIFALLPFLPGGWRPLRLERLLMLLPDPGIREAARELAGKMAARPAPIVPPPEPPADAPWLPGALLTVLLVLVRALAFLTLGLTALLLLGGAGRVLLAWFRSLAPLWKALGRFFRALLALAGEAAERIPAGLHWRRGRKTGTAAAGGGTPRRPWPPTLLREFFARLVLWGRAQGLALGPARTPGEIGRDLAALVPGRREELDALVEGYRRERYGGIAPGRGEMERYRDAWARLVADGAAANGGKENERP